MVAKNDGGASDEVDVNIDGMRAVVKRLQSVEAKLQALGPKFTAAVQGTGVADPGGPVAAAAVWLASEIPGLEQRIRLATGDPGANDPLGGMVSGWAKIDESLITKETAQQIANRGANLADQIWQHSDSPQGIPKSLTDQLKKQQLNPDFAAGFWARLGPEKAADLMARLARDGQTWHDGGRNGDTRSPKQYDADQQEALEALSVSLGTASRTAGQIHLTSDFGQRMAKHGPEAAGQLLRSGKFDKNFLLQAATEIYNWRVQGVRNHQAEPKADTALLVGSDKPPGSYDPMVNALAALSRNLDASQAWFTPQRLRTLLGGTGNKDENDTGRSHLHLGDDGKSLGDFVSVAGAGVRDRGPRGRRSAEVAAQTVHEAAKLNNLLEGFKPGMGEVLSSYIHDVARASWSGERGPNNQTVAQMLDLKSGHPHWTTDDQGVQAGDPIGANFDINDLRKILPQVETNDDAWRSILAGARQYSAGYLGYAARQSRTDGSAVFQEAENRVGSVFGVLGSKHALGKIGEAAARDQRRAELLGLIKSTVDIWSVTDIVGKLPGDKTADFVGLARGQIEDAVVSGLLHPTKSGEQAKADTTDDDLIQQLQNMAAGAASDGGLLHTKKDRSKSGLNLDPAKWFKHYSKFHPLHAKDEKFFDDQDVIMPPEAMTAAQRAAYSEYLTTALTGHSSNLENAYRSASQSWTN
ncbi:hypothetical protein GCM10023191_084790 [Actinoallomurus oryzae]|uniref:Uncharacterized protein n=1 Tax=Actinoallomurus oryzae TaxID=502180 RepID=A0ABP8R1B1_9ACTN